MTPNPPDEASWGWKLKLCSASERGLRLTDCARFADCRRIRRSTGLPGQNLYQDSWWSRIHGHSPE
eukprot:5554841-Alexandrium_andersonii.AAC.1